MALIVLTFLYLQNQFFESDISSSLLVSKSEFKSQTFNDLLLIFPIFLVNAVAGIFQIILFTTFIYFEEGSLAGLKNNVQTHIFADVRTTFKMALPPIFLILTNELLLISSKILPMQSQSASNYSIFGVAIFTVLLLKRRFFLSQAVAVYLIARGLDLFPTDGILFDTAQSEPGSISSFYGHFAIVWAILCYGLSYVILEKVLKSSDVSLWIRGIQLNLFTVPLSLMVSYTNDWLTGDTRGFFDSFNIIAWFFIIFKIAQQMMEMFVIKVADSIYRCLSLSTALVIIGIMKNPFTIEESYEYVPVKLGTGLVLSGVCLYIVMDHYFLKWGELSEQEDEQEYRESPVDFDSKVGYQTVQTVSSSVSNADVFLKLIDETGLDS